MGNIKPSNIPNRLRNVSAEHPYVAGAVDIYDDVKGKNQQSINTSNDAKFTQMDSEIEALVNQDVVPVDSLPSVSEADSKKIYRVVGGTRYTDYMVNATGDGWKELAEFSFPGIDNVPIAESPNLVKSGGVFASFGQEIDIITDTAVNNRHPYLDGKKVLMLCTGTTTVLYNGSTSLGDLYDGVLSYYDFTGLDNIKIYVAPNENGKIVYTTNEVIINYVLNERKVWNLKKEPSSVNYGEYYINSLGTISFMLQSYPIVVFPTVDSRYHGIPINAYDLFLIDNELYHYDNGFLPTYKEDYEILKHPASSATEWWNVDELAGNKVYINAKVSDQKPLVIYVSEDGTNYSVLNRNINEGIGSVFDLSPYVKARIYFENRPEIVIKYTKIGVLVDSQKKSYSCIVAQDGSGDFDDLWDAVKYAKLAEGNNPLRHFTIFVKPGEYEMPTYHDNDNTYAEYRNLSIVGASKNECIIYNKNSTYIIQSGSSNQDNAPLKLAGNVLLKNLTIRSTSEETPQGGNYSAYCVHLDANCFEGSHLEIDNCNLYNDHFACLGIGVRKNYTITVKNSILSSGGLGQVQSGWNGAIVCHDGNNGDGTLQIIDCLISSDSDLAVAVASAYGNNINVLLLRNAFFANSQNILNIYGQHVVIDPKSCLNNINL